MNRAQAALVRLAAGAVFLLGAAGGAAAAVEDFVGRPVVDVQLVSQGQRLRDASMLDLVATRVGAPLSMRHVRESLTHLFSLGRFEDVLVDATASGTGVALRYDLVPRRVASRLAFRGALALSRGDLREAIAAQYGMPLRVDLAAAAADTLAAVYEERGYLAPRIEARLERDASGRDVVAFDIDAGPQPRLARIDVTGVAAGEVPALLDRLNLGEGGRFDRAELDQRLADYVDELRAARHYQARLRYRAELADDRQTITLALDVDRGPRVAVFFTGDPLPADQQAELVPVEREGSVDEDLLEDSSRRIETYLRSLGYRDAVVSHTRESAAGTLAIVFTITHRRLFRIGEVEIAGETAVPESRILELLALTPGAPFVAEQLDRGVAAVRELYRRLGYARVQVRPDVLDLAVPQSGDRVLVRCVVTVDEGVRTLVGGLAVEGNDALPASSLLAGLGSAIGSPYYAPLAAADRDAILLRYLNEGYERASVSVTPIWSDDFTTVDVRFAVAEGMQTVVDHILIVGNEQIESATIRREVPLVEGDPLGADELALVRQRLGALGLFRRIELRQFSHGGGSRRDLVIVVDEAPATHVAAGGGVQLSPRLRRESGGSRQATERFEIAPRAFFQVGRRNLGGKNRSVDLFTRVSVRRQNESATDETPESTEAPESTLGFNEYRVLGTYREPRALGLNVDVLLSGFGEQTIRPSFNLFSRGVNAQVRRPLSPTVSAAVGYQFGENRVSGKQFASPEDEPIVDRLFPEIVLSAFSGNLISDTRDDPFEPTRGALLGVETELAGRLVGSEVGFAKTFVEGFAYRRLPGARRIVFAGGARLGLAAPFRRRLTLPVAVDAPGGRGPTGPVEVRDLPVSERFFAGGDTTVRGFALDRLGDEATIDPNGFPTGGNAMLILNTELRVPVWRDLQMVGFLDAGNVFARVEDITLGRIRGSTGFGVRYRSPVGPIRIDLGFKLDRRTFAAGDREPLTALHISIGQAF